MELSPAQEFHLAIQALSIGGNTLLKNEEFLVLLNREFLVPAVSGSRCNIKSQKGMVIIMADQIFPLSRMEEGSFATVKELRSSGTMRRRMLDIGLVEGTNVECVRKSPAGDPVAYLIRGAVIALRSEDSASVLVC